MSIGYFLWALLPVSLWPGLLVLLRTWFIKSFSGGLKSLNEVYSFMVLGYIFLAVILIFSVRTWIKVIREFRRPGRGSDRGDDV